MAAKKKISQISDDPLWYKDAVIYQLHIKAFYDSDGDGIGDFVGLTEKLDYLENLGVTTLWLLPFYPSPMKDDGYDIASYSGIHPNYGSMRDFRTFLNEAHRRGLRVVTELVINHTSDQHPWFQRSRRSAPGSAWRNFYVWSDTPERYNEARIIFKDFETSNWAWDPVAQAYYWHRFYGHQPDLNFDNPAVTKAVLQTLDLWMGMGVDGLRLDAIPYLYEREGTSCENLPETHEFLKRLRRHVDDRFKNRMLLAEANQWPDDARQYFGEGDECHVAFHFPLMPRLFMSVAMEDRYPIVDIMQQTPDIPENSQWAVFLRNHDELTLEMVTDEDRDYMYRAYAEDRQARINLGIRRRLAPLLGNQRKRIELMNALLFSFPGTPIIYYGDEIGMGDNIYLGDRHGVRTPMQWSPDRNAGFSRANPQRLFLPVIIDPEYHYEAVNVESQQNNPQSLLWWMKRLIDLRKRYKAFGRGALEFLHPENRKVLTFVRTWEDETILVVANLSRFVQYIELDMSRYRGMTPVELFGQTHFPEIGTLPYFLTLGPHGFYWFALRNLEARPELMPGAARAIPIISAENWEEILVPHAAELREGLIGYFQSRRWFGGKARGLKGAEIVEAIDVPGTAADLTIVRVDYVEGTSDFYVLPLAIATGEESHRISVEMPDLIVARLQGRGREGILYEPIAEKDFEHALLNAIRSRRQLKGLHGEVRAVRRPNLKKIVDAAGENLEPTLLRAEQSNTALIYGDSLFLKLFRRVERGINVDFEVTRFLMDKTNFRHIAPLAGGLEYVPKKKGEPATLAMLQQFVPNGGDAWRYTLDELGRFFDRVLSEREEIGIPTTRIPTEPLLQLAEMPLPEHVVSALAQFASDAELLGRRTGEMHSALASRNDDPDFAPEPFTPFYQRSIYQHMRGQAISAVQMLRKCVRTLPETARILAETLLENESELLARFRRIADQKIKALRTRVHGDYHLGQVLHTGKDFIIIDFEGEPSRPIGERRIKRSPLRDVSGMLRSFHYAPYAVLLGRAPGVSLRVEDVSIVEPSARFWHRWVSAIYLRSYIEATADSGIIPSAPEQLEILLDSYLLEKAMYELGYELNNRPEWVEIPLRGILQLLGTEP
ncbi:MAG: maltose alpha-D-glucosyltransferase [Thermoanaerobaculia bacterium]